MKTCSFMTLATGLTFIATAASSSAESLVERGSYLVNGPAACANCHTQRGPDLFSTKDPGKYLAGGEKFVSPTFETYSRNITPDNDTGIGSWKDADIDRAIRQGISKDGSTLGSPMPFAIYNKMADEDVNAIVAYLHTVKPIHNEVPAPKYKIPLRSQPEPQVRSAPPKADKIAYGSYLVNAVAHCFECHTPQVGPVRDYEHQTGAGGFPFSIAGTSIQSRNITPDNETGIGTWTDAEVKRAIIEGIGKDGAPLIPIMPYPYLKNMSADDVDAIVAYLHTIPPVKKQIPKNPSLKSLQE